VKEWIQYRRTNRRSVIIMIILLSLLLGACVNKEQHKAKLPAKSEKQKVPAADIGAEWKLPISIPKNEGEFDKFIGWLSNQQILYVTNYEQSSNVFAYNLLTGEHKFIYKTENPIVNVQISPSRKLVLVHSAPSSYEGLVTIIDKQGKVQSKRSFPSYELAFEWNPFHESEVLVSSFNEDWSYQLYLLNTQNANASKITLPQPFVKYISNDQIAFLNWDKNNPDLFASLIVKRLKSGAENTVFPQAIQFSAFNDVLMTVSIREQEQNKAIYSFFDKRMKKLFTFSIPQLTNFSDWIVPFYDFNMQRGQFITLSPVHSGEADSYMDGFQLIAYNLKKGSSELILKGLENEPIAFSPSGEALLFGNRFEKLIDVDAKKIYNLLHE